MCVRGCVCMVRCVVRDGAERVYVAARLRGRLQLGLAVLEAPLTRCVGPYACVHVCVCVCV